MVAQAKNLVSYNTQGVYGVVESFPNVNGVHPANALPNPIFFPERWRDIPPPGSRYPYRGHTRKWHCARVNGLLNHYLIYPVGLLPNRQIDRKIKLLLDHLKGI